MKALLKILYILLFLVVLILLAGLFLPKEANIQASVYINASDKIVFDQINDLKNWKTWSPWEQADSTMQIIYGEQTIGEGASYSWTSKHSGSGKLIITQSIPLSKVAMELDFGEQGKASTYWTIEREKELTKLTWIFDNDNLGYFERYFMVLFRKNMLNTFNRGLQKIKEIAEDLRLSRISEIKIVAMEKQPAMVIIDSCEVEKIDSLMIDMFDRVTRYMERRKLEPVGPPFTIYYSWNPEGVSKFACGIPIEKRTWGWKDYSVIELPEGEAATVVHWGKFDSEKPYLALDQYIRENALSVKDFIWEVYLTNPSSEPDTAKWKKQIYYPVSQEE